MSLISNEMDPGSQGFSHCLIQAWMDNLSTYWQGRHITAQDASILCFSLQDSIARCVFSKPHDDQILDSILSKFFHGHQDNHFALADRLIEPFGIELNPPHHQDLIKQAGLVSFGKNIKKKLLLE